MTQDKLSINDIQLAIIIIANITNLEMIYVNNYICTP